VQLFRRIIEQRIRQESGPIAVERSPDSERIREQDAESA